MKNTLLIVLVMLTTSGIAYGQKTMNPKPFSGIDVSGNIYVELIEADKDMLEVTMIKGDYGDLDIEVDDGILEIDVDRGMLSTKKVKASIKVHYTTLNSIDVSSGSKVEADHEIQSNAMLLDASSGAVIISGIKCDKLTADVSSGGAININGSSEHVTADASSGGVIKGSTFTANHAILDVSSGGAITVGVTETLKAEASSGGVIKYKGDPEILEMDNRYSSIKKI